MIIILKIFYIYDKEINEVIYDKWVHRKKVV